MSRWQAKLENKQAVLGRIVDIGAELFAISSAVRTRRRSRKEHPERARLRRSSSPTCSASRPAAAPTSCSASCSPTTTTRATSSRSEVLEGRHTWIEEGIVDPSELGADGGEPQVAGQPTDEGVPATNGDAAHANGDTPIAAKVQ